MSIVTRPRTMNESFARSSASNPKPSPDVLLHSCHHEPVAEAPEWAAQTLEAPESRRGRSAEAPDAGVRRAASFDNEFTQGRSRS